MPWRANSPFTWFKMLKSWRPCSWESIGLQDRINQWIPNYIIWSKRDKKSIKEEIILEWSIRIDDSHLLPHYFWGDCDWSATKSDRIFRNCHCYCLSQMGRCFINGMPLQVEEHSQKDGQLPDHWPGHIECSVDRFGLDNFIVRGCTWSGFPVDFSRNVFGDQYNGTVKRATASPVVSIPKVRTNHYIDHVHKCSLVHWKSAVLTSKSESEVGGEVKVINFQWSIYIINLILFFVWILAKFIFKS